MTRTALIVEDETGVGCLLAELLRHWGFEPTVLGEGKPAVHWVQEHRPDLVLLDLMLPDLDGLDVCEALKLNRATNLIPIIMITARSQPGERERGLRVGANHYLTKPFTSEELNRAILDAFNWQEELERHGTEGEVHFHLLSDTRYLEELNQLAASLFLFSGLSEHQIKHLTIAVRELGTNAIEWGHHKQIDRIVTVVYRIDPEKITIHIRDTGPGFNPKDLPHAACADDPLAHLAVRESLGMREGGFGILMTRGLVDDLDYNETGNEVRLVKFFPTRGKGEAQEKQHVGNAL